MSHHNDKVATHNGQMLLMAQMKAYHNAMKSSTLFCTRGKVFKKRICFLWKGRQIPNWSRVLLARFNLLSILLSKKHANYSHRRARIHTQYLPFLKVSFVFRMMGSSFYCALVRTNWHSTILQWCNSFSTLCMFCLSVIHGHGVWGRYIDELASNCCSMNKWCFFYFKKVAWCHVCRK